MAIYSPMAVGAFRPNKPTFTINGSDPIDALVRFAIRHGIRGVKNIYKFIKSRMPEGVDNEHKKKIKQVIEEKQVEEKKPMSEPREGDREPMNDAGETTTKPFMTLNATYNGGAKAAGASGSIGSGGQQDHFYPASLSMQTQTYNVNVKRRLLLPNTVPEPVDVATDFVRLFTSWYTPSASNIYNYIPSEIMASILKEGYEYIQLSDIKCCIDNSWVASEMQQTANERNVSDRPEIAFTIDQGISFPVNDVFNAVYTNDGIDVSTPLTIGAPVTFTYTSFTEDTGSPMAEFYVNGSDLNECQQTNPPILAMGKYKVWNGEDKVCIYQKDTPFMPLWKGTQYIAGAAINSYQSEQLSFFTNHESTSLKYKAPATSLSYIDNHLDILDQSQGHQYPNEGWLKMFMPETNNQYNCYLHVTYKCKITVKRFIMPYSRLRFPTVQIQAVAIGGTINTSSLVRSQFLHAFPKYYTWRNNPYLYNQPGVKLDSLGFSTIVVSNSAVKLRPAALKLMLADRERISKIQREYQETFIEELEDQLESAKRLKAEHDETQDPLDQE